MADLTRHPDVLDLAEYAEGLLDPDRHAAVDHHVRDCLDCTQVLADLDELPGALAQAPMPPMPDDVAARIDQAIAAESTARASLWSGAARAKAEVTPLRSRRRWLAPVVAAAAVLGVIGIAVPALDDSGGSDDSASTAESSTTQDRNMASEDQGVGAAPDQSDGAAQTVALSSDHFGRDVIDTYYHGDTALRMLAPMSTDKDDEATVYRDRIDSIPDVCSSDAPSTVPNGEVDEVTYDGEPALLLRIDAGPTDEAIAYRCDGDQADILDAVTLRPAG
jgi:negative regulator of sigma E activity